MKAFEEAYSTSFASSWGVQLPLTSATGCLLRLRPVFVVPGRKDQLSEEADSLTPSSLGDTAGPERRFRLPTSCLVGWKCSTWPSGPVLCNVIDTHHCSSKIQQPRHWNRISLEASRCASVYGFDARHARRLWLMDSHRPVLGWRKSLDSWPELKHPLKSFSV